MMDFLVNVWDPNSMFWIQQHVVVHSFLTPFMIGLSAVAKDGGIWVILGLILFFRKEYREVGITLLAALVCVAVFGDGILKHAVMRLRPCIDYPWVPMAIHTPAVNDYSFPSCHSYGSFASATVLFCYYKKWGISAFVLSVFIAFSRLYLFVHYPTDVAAGALLGIGTGIGAYFCVKFVITWRKNRVRQYSSIQKNGNK